MMKGQTFTIVADNQPVVLTHVFGGVTCASIVSLESLACLCGMGVGSRATTCICGVSDLIRDALPRRGYRGISTCISLDVYLCRCGCDSLVANVGGPR